MAALLLALVATAASAQIVVVVPGTSDPYLAGMPNGTVCCGGDSAPTQSPVQVVGLALAPGATVTFSATGSVDNAAGTPTLPPDGSAGFFTTPPNDGISGATWPINATVGVFLDDSLPTSTPAPADLDFSAGAGTGFATLSPALKQAFYIGDGLTGNGTGAVQTFIVPAGATRLFLGTSDGFGWANNTGSFTVTVSSSAVPAPAPTQIPTLSETMLALLALAVALATASALRRTGHPS